MPKHETYGFVDRLNVTKETPENMPKDGKNSPWDFRAPEYDQRSSCFINAGSDYGSGRTQPVGHTGEPKQVVPALPQNSFCKNLSNHPHEIY